MTTNEEYWIKREQEAIQQAIKEDLEKATEIQRLLLLMTSEIVKEIAAFYAKYATFEGINLTEAKKIVDEFDVISFQEKAKRYVNNRDFSEKANKELKLYNTKMKISREQMLKKEIELIIKHNTAIVEKETKDYLTDSVYQEYERQAGILGQSAGINKRKVEAIVDMKFAGVKWSDRLWYNSETMQKDVEKIIANIMVRGRHANEYVSDMKKHLKSVEKCGQVHTERVKALLLTETARVQAQAMLLKFQEEDEQSDVDLEYVYIAKLDSRTSKVCRGLDGKTFKVKDAKIGVNFYPMHVRCRSSAAILPVRKKRKRKYTGGKVTL